MKRQPLLAIVRGERIDNVSAKGGRSYARVRGLLQYVAFGHYAEQPSFALRGAPGQEPEQRGDWLDQTGRAQPHEAVEGWAKEKVHRFGYEHTYQLLLSTRDGGLPAADFNRALQQGSDISQVREWRLMVHDDSDHQHAHAILFSHEKLSSSRYKEWQQTMQTELGRRSALVSEREAMLIPELGQQDERSGEQDQGWELGYD